MRKINNGKFRNNNGSNSIYSLNYKFDSVCTAGKFCGTALELIKKYNELAKEAHSNGNYVEMEVFRQYAEHYRKIVTEINERKNQQRELRNSESNEAENDENKQLCENSLVETEAADQTIANNSVNLQETDTPETPKPTKKRRRFTLVTVSENAETVNQEVTSTQEKAGVSEGQSAPENIDVEAKPKRRNVTRRRKTAETNEK